MKCSLFALAFGAATAYAAAPIATYDSFGDLSAEIFDHPEAVVYYRDDTKQWLLFDGGDNADKKAINTYSLLSSDKAISTAENLGFTCGEFAESQTLAATSTLTEVLVKRASCKTRPCPDARTCWRRGCRMCMGGGIQSDGRCFGAL